MVTLIAQFCTFGSDLFGFLNSLPCMEVLDIRGCAWIGYTSRVHNYPKLQLFIDDTKDFKVREVILSQVWSPRLRKKFHRIF